MWVGSFMRKISRVLTMLLFACSSTVIFASCATDPYKEYVSSGLKAKEFLLKGEESCISSFLVSTLSTENAKIFNDFESYAAYDFPLEYTEEFFEKNNLLVFVAVAGSSDEMQFLDILTHDGKLYPCYSRVKISSGVAEDIIYFSYCAELSKTDNFKLGEVIYKYR